MRIALLAGYNTNEQSSVWLETSCEGTPLLETRLRAALRLHPNPIAVLSGSIADELLRQCRSLDQCEIVFDTNQENASLMTNIRAALKAAPDETLIWPAEVHIGRPEIFTSLKNFAVQHGPQVPAHVVQTVENGELVESGFPILITSTGRSLFLRHPEIASLTEPRVTYEYLPLKAAPGLA